MIGVDLNDDVYTRSNRKYLIKQMKLFTAIASAAVIGASLITINPVEAMTSADYWASLYKSKFLHRVHKSCARGRQMNEKSWEYIQPIKIQGMNEEISSDQGMRR